MTYFSVLDLSTISEGSTVSDALENTRRMAVAAEDAGYKRFWLAEHHGMTGIASAATSLVIGHAGYATKRIRIGSGGIMLPNHSPYIIAEQFGTLAALFPVASIWVWVVRPGTDMATARALRRDMQAAAERFPDDILELKAWLGPRADGQRVIAVPGMGSQVPLYILGSSLYSAHLAAALGLPYAFASHFAPDQLFEAIDIYRSRFQPSDQLDQPYVMAGVMGVVPRRTTRRPITSPPPSSNSSTCGAAGPDNIRRRLPTWTSTGRRWSGPWWSTRCNSPRWGQRRPSKQNSNASSRTPRLTKSSCRSRSSMSRSGWRR